MFTGLIEEIGSIRNKQPQGDSLLLEISCPLIAPGINIGDSIAVNGVCLTAVRINSSSFTADVSPETINRSNLATLGVGSKVNLEQALAANGRLGGHIVQGHVDAIGSFLGSEPSGSGWNFRFFYPEKLESQIVEKGSIAINGISLTIASLNSGAFCVAVVPHSFQKTTLGSLKPGDKVNLETDILGKYVEKMLTSRTASVSNISESFLKKHGFGN